MAEALRPKEQMLKHRLLAGAGHLCRIEAYIIGAMVCLFPSEGNAVQEYFSKTSIVPSLMPDHSCGAIGLLLLQIYTLTVALT